MNRGRPVRPRRISPSRLAIRRRRASAAAYGTAAQRRLKKFRRGSLLAVSFTGLFLLLSGVPADAPAQDSARAVDTLFVDSAAAAQLAAQPDTTTDDPAQSVEEAAGTVRDLARDFRGLAPKLLIALVLVCAAALLVRVLHIVLSRVLVRWEKAEAVTAMSGVVIWLLAIGVALSVVAGDARALVGSVGLLGLALSWALQAPIESFAGWLLNSFEGYYRIGDRIAVGDVFGDVYDIDILNTTVWEAGGPEKSVQGAQPTGALITFPNSEVLRTNVVNYTRKFPYVWDEVTIGITNESDVRYAMSVIGGVADRVVGEHMAAPIGIYRGLLEKEGLAFDVSDRPQVFVSLSESWTDIIVRYLVGARERRKWASELIIEINEELAKPEHEGRIRGSYPVRRISMEDAPAVAPARPTLP